MAPPRSAAVRDEPWELLTDGELAVLLERRGLRPTVVDALVHDRETAGGAWRIGQELDR